MRREIAILKKDLEVATQQTAILEERLKKQLQEAQKSRDYYQSRANSYENMYNRTTRELNTLKNKKSAWQKLTDWFLEYGWIILGVLIVAVLIWIVFAYIVNYVNKEEAPTGMEIVQNKTTKLYGVYNHDSDSLIIPYRYHNIRVAATEPKTFFTLCSVSDATKDTVYSLASSTGTVMVANLDTVAYNKKAWAFIGSQNGKQFVIDNNGAKLVSTINDYVVDMEAPYDTWFGNIIPTKQKDAKGWTLINRKTDKPISPQKWQIKTPSTMNSIAVKRDDGSYWGVIDINGKLSIIPKMKDIWGGQQGLYLCRINANSPIRVYREDGEFIFSLSDKSMEMGSYTEDLAPVWKGNMINYVDTLGKYVGPGFYYTAIVDKHGKYANNSPWFRDGKANVIYNGQEGYIDKDFTFHPNQKED